MRADQHHDVGMRLAWAMRVCGDTIIINTTVVVVVVFTEGIDGEKKRAKKKSERVSDLGILR